jgi:hypothetical protein
MEQQKHALVCDICHKGQVSLKMEDIAFWQFSHKGYVPCRVTVMAGTCEVCGAKSVLPGSDKIFDQAFRRGYAQLEKDGI